MTDLDRLAREAAEEIATTAIDVDILPIIRRAIEQAVEEATAKIEMIEGAFKTVNTAASRLLDRH